MLLPDKHIKMSESLIGLGSFVVEDLATPKTIDEIWKGLQRAYTAGEYPVYQSFENLVLAIDFLYSIGIVTASRNGKIIKCA